MKKSATIDGRPARGLGVLLDVDTHAALERVAYERRQQTERSNVGAATIAREAIEQYLKNEVQA
jgi:hypothetical protein